MGVAWHGVATWSGHQHLGFTSQGEWRCLVPALVLARAVLQGPQLQQVLQILRKTAQHAQQAGSREEERPNAPPRIVPAGRHLVLEHQLRTNNVRHAVLVCPLKEDQVRAWLASALLAKHRQRRDLVIAVTVTARRARLVQRVCTVWVQDRNVQVRSVRLAQRRGRVLVIRRIIALRAELVSSR